MKKSKFIIPLAAAFLLVGCAGEGGSLVSSSIASSSESSSSSSSASASASTPSSGDTTGADTTGGDTTGGDTTGGDTTGGDTTGGDTTGGDTTGGDTTGGDTTGGDTTGGDTTGGDTTGGDTTGGDSGTTGGDSGSTEGGSTEGGGTEGGSTGGDSSSKTDLTIEDLKNAAESYSSKADGVSNGIITKEFYNKFAAEGEPNPTTTTTTYEFGTESFHYKENDIDIDILKDGDSYVGVVKDKDGNYTRKDFDTPNYYFSSYFGGEEKAAGVEGFLSSLIDTADDSYSMSFTASSENDTISFSYSYLTFNYGEPSHYYLVSGSFPKYADSVLTDFTAKIVDYSYWKGDEGDEGDSFTYDSEKGTVTIKDGVEPDSTTKYTFNQTAGERTYTSNVNLSTFNYTSFSLSYGTDENESTSIDENTVINMTVGDNTGFYLKDALPSTANADFDTPVVQITTGDVNGLHFGNYCNGVISVDAKAAGEYKVQVVTKNCNSLTFTIKVEAPKPESITVSAYYNPITGGYSDADTNEDGDVLAATGATYYLNAYVYPNDASQTMKVTVKLDDNDATVGTDYTLGNADIVLDIDRTSVYTFVPLKNGTYTITFTSSEKEEVAQTITIVAADRVDFAAILSGSYTVSGADWGNPVVSVDGDYTYPDFVSYTYGFSFTPSDSDPKTGTATVTYQGNDSDDQVKKTGTETASYAIEKKTNSTGKDLYELTFTHTSGDENIISGENAPKLAIDLFGNFVFNYNTNSGYQGMEKDPEPTFDDELYGEWYVRYYEDTDEEGNPEEDSTWYDFTLNLTNAHKAFGTIHGKDDDSGTNSGDLKCNWSVEYNDEKQCYIITFEDMGEDDMGDNATEYDGVFKELPATATVEVDANGEPTTIEITATDDNYVFKLTPAVDED